MPKRLVLEFPAELPVEALENSEGLQKAKEGLVLELLRQSRISQGKAAELLGLSLWDFHELLAKHGLPIANFTLEQLEQQRRDAHE